MKIIFKLNIFICLPQCYLREDLFFLSVTTSQKKTEEKRSRILKISFWEIPDPALVVKNPPAIVEYARDRGSVHESGRSSGEGNSNPLQQSCLENPMGRGAWWATVHGAAKSRTWLNTAHSWFIFIGPAVLFHRGLFFFLSQLLLHTHKRKTKEKG